MVGPVSKQIRLSLEYTTCIVFMAPATKLATYVFGLQVLSCGEESNRMHHAGCGGDDDGTLFSQHSLFSWSARMPRLHMQQYRGLQNYLQSQRNLYARNILYKGGKTKLESSVVLALSLSRRTISQPPEKVPLVFAFHSLFYSQQAWN